MLRVFLAGNLGRDAELKITQGGDSVCSFSVAVNLRVKGEERTEWVRCSLWGKRGEALSKHLSKGSRVAITGPLEVRTYEKEGETRASTECPRVDEITLMGGGAKDESRDDSRSERRQEKPRSQQTNRRAPTPREEAPADDFDNGYGGGGDDEIPF